jgi:hypothetical protein
MPTAIDVPATFHSWFEQKIQQGLFKEKHRERAYLAFKGGVTVMEIAKQHPKEWVWSLPSGLDKLPREFDLLHGVTTVVDLRQEIADAGNIAACRALFDLCVAFKYIQVTY